FRHPAAILQHARRLVGRSGAGVQAAVYPVRYTADSCEIAVPDSGGAKAVERWRAQRLRSGLCLHGCLVRVVAGFVNEADPHETAREIGAGVGSSQLALGKGHGSESGLTR